MARTSCDHIAYLWAVFDVVAFVEAKVTQVVGRRHLVGFASVSRQGQVRKVISQGAEAVHDVCEGAAGGRALVQLMGKGLLEAKEERKIRGRRWCPTFNHRQLGGHCCTVFIKVWF